MIFILILSFLSQVHAADFESWKTQYIKRASKRGLPTKFLKPIMQEVTFMPEVIEKDRNQITSNTEIDYEVWIKQWLRENPSRIDESKKMMQKHLHLLEQVEKKYGVDKEIIVSLWGVETFFGEIMGDYDLLNSLASLSFEGRRRRFFETQLTASLRLIYQGHVTRERLKGSWAGATGQCQFMPSNIPGFARDFDGDGKKDIWTNHADVFASIANLLKKSGWKKGLSVGSLVKNTHDARFNPKRYRSPAQYQKLGFVNWDGSPVEGRWKRAAEEIPFKNSPWVLRGTNYNVLMKWNKSSLFAALNIILYDSLRK